MERMLLLLSCCIVPCVCGARGERARAFVVEHDDEGFLSGLQPHCRLQVFRRGRGVGYRMTGEDSNATTVVVDSGVNHQRMEQPVIVGMNLITGMLLLPWPTDIPLAPPSPPPPFVCVCVCASCASVCASHHSHHLLLARPRPLPNYVGLRQGAAYASSLLCTCPANRDCLAHVSPSLLHIQVREREVNAGVVVVVAVWCGGVTVRVVRVVCVCSPIGCGGRAHSGFLSFDHTTHRLTAVPLSPHRAPPVRTACDDTRARILPSAIIRPLSSHHRAPTNGEDQWWLEAST